MKTFLFQFKYNYETYNTAGHRDTAFKENKIANK